RGPTYDRVNGITLPFGPVASFAGGRGEIEALARYRSDLGKVDPSLSAGLAIGQKSLVRLDAARGTFTNDAWIWQDFVNTLSALAFGEDTRNYYRADRAELTLRRSVRWMNVDAEPFFGGLTERAWSGGPAGGETRAPWSLF